MTNPLKMPCQIWTVRSQIWPDFAKSEICPKSEIWLFALDFNDLMGRFQIWLGCLPNLNPNLDFSNYFKDFCQISDLAKSPPKGVGDLPAKRGRFTTYPLGIVLGPKSQTEPQSDDGGQYRQASTAVVFHPSSQPKKETTHG